MNTHLLRLSAILLLPIPLASAETRLARIFGNGMVVQQEKPVTVWGWDDPDTEITVAFGGDSKKTKSDAKGGWKVTLPAAKADGQPRTLTATGTTSVTFDDILLGEVWLASGQSNMDWRLSAATGGRDEIKAADFPKIRLFRVEKDVAAQSKQDVATGKWVACSPTTAGSFSAVAYFFGKNLHQDLKVPVGLVMSAVSGTPIEPWMSPETHALLPPPPPPLPGAKKMWPNPSQLFEGMIRPLSPVGLRGVIWYQGEGNSKDGARYTAKMQGLVDGWRKQWADPFPFYFVQIGQRPYVEPLGPDAKPFTLPTFWEAQAQAAKLIPDSGLAVINDISELDLHPLNKKDVGHRLALIALAKTYGKKDLVYSGPVFKAMKAEGGKLRISFDHTGSGLASRDGGELTWFEIIDADKGDFVKAKAEIVGNEVILSAPDVEKPVAVRFTWDNTAVPNLMNKEGLPAMSFRAGEVPARASY
ncbi:MAG TPA: sialate O-acetylesterase [Luteolibacter sp.]|nr:sialate O-acetylesterase [Luteolibacter sp.]